MVLEWVNFWNRTYIQTVAPEIKLFKLDKSETRVDSLYGEESSSRIYLPPIELRAFHLDNAWAQLLGPFAVTEEEENIIFITNFDDMVQKIQEKKRDHVADMYITYSGSGTPKASKSGKYFTLKINGQQVTSFDLTTSQRNTVKKLGESIHALDNFSVTLEGRNDSSLHLVDFQETGFYNAALQSYSLETAFNNVTDVIEAGDVILTNKWRLYEVMNANPSGDFAWEWVTYSLSCKLARLDTVSLPGDYEAQVQEHQYNIKHILEME